jgi:hypothetical protein
MVSDSGVGKTDEERFKLTLSLIYRYDGLKAAGAQRAVFLLLINTLLLLGLVLSLPKYLLGAQHYSFLENIILYLLTVTTTIFLVLSFFYALEAVRVGRKTGSGPPDAKDLPPILFFNPQDTQAAFREASDFTEKFRNSTREQMRHYAEAELFFLTQFYDKQVQALNRAHRFLLISFIIFPIYLVLLFARFF